MTRTEHGTSLQAALDRAAGTGDAVLICHPAVITAPLIIPPWTSITGTSQGILIEKITDSDDAGSG